MREPHGLRRPMPARYGRPLRSSAGEWDAAWGAVPFRLRLAALVSSRLPLAVSRARPLPALLFLVVAASACASGRPVRPAEPSPIGATPAVLDPAFSAVAATSPGGGIAEADLEYLRTRALMVPVQGIRADKVEDTFNAPRGRTRRHNALDILAPRGTPVLAADDGRVYKLRSNAAGGTTIYALDPEGRFVYYYAHLDHYREGLVEGAPLAKGEVIGYVGTTGNAPRNIPHLHFQVMRLTTEHRYWDGIPINPRPFFVLDGSLASNQ